MTQEHTGLLPVLSGNGWEHGRNAGTILCAHGGSLLRLLVHPAAHSDTGFLAVLVTQTYFFSSSLEY